MSARLIDMPTLETERLILRGPKLEDYAAWETFMASPRAQYVGGPVGQHEAWRAFGHLVGLWALRGHGAFIITQKGNDQGLGTVGPWLPIDWPEPEIGWTCWEPRLEGTGMMYEASRAALDYVFHTLKWETAVSYIDPENPRSVALAKRLGAHHDTKAKGPHPDDHVYRHAVPERLI
ncbi:MAG: GNAT family N-acetyltransferase [Pseudomonadota bacterium]